MAAKLLFLLTFLLTAAGLQAQLCQGSLGEPIVNITFGAGTNPGPALNPGVTSYNYIFNDCPNDGSYTIRNRTASCFNNTWHTLSGDHTGDANGYFMLVNASYNPGAFYTETVKGLCAGTTYEFAAWVMNVILPTSCLGNPIQPNLTFRLEKPDGTLLQSYNTGNIISTSRPEWKQYGFYFTTPSSPGDVVLRIVNNSTGGCGNDIVLDDITFRACGPKLTTAIAGSSTDTRDICRGDSVVVNLQGTMSTGYTNPVITWQQSRDGISFTDIPASNSLNYSPQFTRTMPAGKYFFRMAVAELQNFGVATCRVYSPVLTIIINDLPFPGITSNQPVCANSTLSVVTSGVASYRWAGPANFNSIQSSFSINNIQQAQSGVYRVVATSAAGCSSIDSLVVAVKPSPVASVSFSDTTICSGSVVPLQAFGGTAYTWTPSAEVFSPASSTTSAKPLADTRYVVAVLNASACSDTVSVLVKVLQNAVVNAGPDKAIVQGQLVQLDGKIEGSGTIRWSPDWLINSITLTSPVVSPSSDTSYILTAQSTANCPSVSDTVFVKVYRKILVPNAFSPNGDGVNDRWLIPALSAYRNYELVVFDRYGQAVFLSNNYREGWNGTFNNKVLPTGTYYYILNIREGLQPRSTGSVTLLR